MVDDLQAQLAEAQAALRAHVGSWEYAFAMGSSRHGGTDHPRLRAARAKTVELEQRCRDLRARLSEFEGV